MRHRSSQLSAMSLLSGTKQTVPNNSESRIVLSSKDMPVQGLHGHCISSGQLQTLSAPTLLSTRDTVFLNPSGSLRHCEAHLGTLYSSQMSTAWQATEHFGFYLLSCLHTNCHAHVSSSLGWDASENRGAGLHSACACQ